MMDIPERPQRKASMKRNHEIIALREQGLLLREIGAMYGVSAVTVHKVIRFMKGREDPNVQEEFRARIKRAMTERRAHDVATIENFVRDRCDQIALHMDSLQLLSERDLQWLVAAINNC